MAHVLLVDDDPRLVRTLSINLRARGYEVSTATTGASALQLAAQAQPDVIILDMGLPDIDGSIVLEGIRGWSDVPVIVLTARTDPLFSASSLDKGADDYVTKPFSMEELLARVRAALRHGGPRASGAAKAEEITMVTAGNLVIELEELLARVRAALRHGGPRAPGEGLCERRSCSPRCGAPASRARDTTFGSTPLSYAANWKMTQLTPYMSSPKQGWGTGSLLVPRDAPRPDV